jgi:hypothetical protein
MVKSTRLTLSGRGIVCRINAEKRFAKAFWNFFDLPQKGFRHPLPVLPYP